MKRILLLLLLLGIGAAAVFGMNYYNSNNVIKAYEKAGFGSTGEISAMPGSGALRVYVGDSVAEAEKSGLKFRSMDGKNNWSRKLKGEIRNLASSGECIVAVDSTGFIICFDRLGKTLWSKTLTELPDAWISDGRGGMLVEYFRFGSGRLDYIKADGKKTDTIEIEGAKVTAFASDFGKGFTVFVIDTSGDRFQGRLMNFSPEGKMIWAKNMGEQLIYHLEYLNSELVAVVEDGLLKISKKNGEFVASQTGGKVEAFAFTEKVGAMMLKNEGNLYLYVIDKKGVLKKASQVSVDSSKIAVSEIAIISYNSEYMTIYDSKGTKKFDYDFNTVVNNIYFGKDGGIFVDMGMKLQKLEGGKKK